MSRSAKGQRVLPESISSAEVTRRRLLAVGGAALAVGAMGIEDGDDAAAATDSATAAAPPDVDLMEEHGVLKRVLLIYEEASRRISIGEPVPVSQIQDAALVIHDFIEGFHEALEEGYVFPRLTRFRLLVATVNTLYVQHARGRDITQFLLFQRANNLADSTQIAGALDAFVRMYEPHEAREDTVVFPTFRSIQSASQLNTLATTFRDLQRQQFGHDGFNYFVNMVAEVERSLGIYDLNQFTAAQINS